jgi:hypothetical protein
MNKDCHLRISSLYVVQRASTAFPLTQNFSQLLCFGVRGVIIISSPPTKEVRTLVVTVNVNRCMKSRAVRQIMTIFKCGIYSAHKSFPILMFSIEWSPTNRESRELLINLQAVVSAFALTCTDT